MKKIQLAVVGALLMSSASAFAADRFTAPDKDCSSLPKFDEVQAALKAAVGSNGGFDLPMWATVVNNSGRVCVVAKVGETDPWPGSRVISAQKAYTANAFSTENVALSTANLYTQVQPGGTLYGLQHSNPVNPLFAYAGDSLKFGKSNDPMIGFRVGGINVFGGGLALYNSGKKVIGAIGVSGDTSCADHNIAWKMRGTFASNKKSSVAAIVPGGLNGGTKSTNPGANGAPSGGDDNIINDISNGVSTSGFGHPTCIFTTVAPQSNVTNN